MYNQSALEQQLAQGIKTSVGWPWKLLTFSVVVFATVSALYLGMNYGFKGIYLKSKSAELDKNLKQLELKEEQKQNLINIHSQMANISDVLVSRNLAYQVFGFLENSTLKQVKLDSLSLVFAKESRNWKIIGNAQNYETLAQQLEIYKSIDNVKSVDLNSSSYDTQTKLIKFTATITF